MASLLQDKKRRNVRPKGRTRGKGDSNGQKRENGATPSLKTESEKKSQESSALLPSGDEDQIIQRGGTTSNVNQSSNSLTRRTVDGVRSAGIATTEIMRDYPVASSAIGAGIAAGLTVAAIRAWRTSSVIAEAEPGGKRSRQKRQAGTLDRLQEVFDSAKELVNGALDEVRERAGDVGTYAETGLSKVGETLKEGATAIEQGVEQGYEYSKEKAGELFEEHPLLVTTGFLALGLAAGMLFPISRLEKTALGESADEFTRKVATKGRELLDQGKKLAAHAASQTSDAFQEEMEVLNPTKLGRKVKRVAGRLKNMVGDAKD